MSRYGQATLFNLAIIQILAALLILPVPLAAADHPECHAGNFDQQGTVHYVIDGDTVILGDGRKIRLIGIDTPELGHAGRPDQPFARQARDYLITLLHGHQDRIYLHYDQVRLDSYQRTLAHLFFADGTNIEALILARGLATPLVIPPNLGFLDCYRKQAQSAMAARTGIWQQPQYQPRPVSALTGTERGYHIIQGKITHIGDSRTSIWLDMGRKLGLRIIKNDLKYFAKLDINTLAGKTVEARGMLYRRNGQLRIRIRHPADIHILKN